MNNFDLVAPFYDALATLVFGKSIRNAQKAYLTEIPLKANVLILGGGTGWLLSELLDINPSCRVWYIDASAKMIELSKDKTGRHHNRVVFIHGNENTIPKEVKFDAVITHFYLDLFSTKDCEKIIQEIRPRLAEESIWLASDFTGTTWWHNAVLTVMYAFFRIMTGIQINKLPDWVSGMGRNGFLITKSQKFFGDFILATLFKKVTDP